MPTSNFNKQRKRVERIFARLERANDVEDPAIEREALITQVLETLSATGEASNRDEVVAAVDDILEQERLEAERAMRPQWWHSVPVWAWPPIIIVGWFVLIPITRIVLRLFEVLIMAIL